MKKYLLFSLALLGTVYASNAAQHNIYVANFTEWGNDVALYFWGDSEIFGEWPGATPSEKVTLNGVEYNKFVVNGHDGEVAHPIFNNNNNGQQVDLNMITLVATDYYFATNGIDVHQYSDPANADTNFEAPTTFIFAIDNTGWDNLYVYGWADGQAEVFGGWPGAKFSETEVIDGVTYKKVPFPGNGTITYNLIFNNGASLQFDGPSVLSGKDLFIELGEDSFTIVEGGAPDKLYIIGNLKDSHWNPAAGIEMAKNGNVFSAEKVQFVAVEDNINAFFSLTSVSSSDWNDLNGHRYGADAAGITLASPSTVEFVAATGEPEAWQIAPGVYNITVDFNSMMISIAQASSSVEGLISEANDAPQYYNLQGVKVTQPTTGGSYIVRRGDKITKEIIR